MSLTERAEAVRRMVADAADRAGRNPADITIVAVSKMFPRELVDEAYAAGFRVFGESRVQEIRQKYTTPLPADAELHMIGTLQTNKIRQLLPFVRCVESLDRPHLLEALEREAAHQEVQCNVLIEVNIAGDEHKTGCDIPTAWDMSRAISAAPHLHLAGLMTIAPLVADPQLTRPTFAALRTLRDEMQQKLGFALPVLSMGMSNDFPIAIEEGASHLRIGRAIFGPRQPAS